MAEVITSEQAAILVRALDILTLGVDQFNAAGWAAKEDDTTGNMLGLIRTSERFRNASRAMRDALFSASIHGEQQTLKQAGFDA